jgi:NPCBM/NEW2 domain
VAAPFLNGPREFLSEMQEFDVKNGAWPVAFNGHLGNGEDYIPVRGVRSPKGIGMHPNPLGFAAVKYRLDKKAKRFTATVALNDTAYEEPANLAVFEVLGDGKSLWKSEPFKAPPGRTQEVDLDIAGFDVLELRVHATFSHFGLHAVWLEPRILAD